jgi:hypothetical protein
VECFVEISELRWKKIFFKEDIDVKGEQNYLNVFLFCIEFSQDIFAFVELSHDTFTFFTNGVLFSMFQNYLDIFLFFDRIFTHVCRTVMITISIYNSQVYLV